MDRYLNCIYGHNVKKCTNSRFHNYLVNSYEELLFQFDYTTYLREQYKIIKQTNYRPTQF